MYNVFSDKERLVNILTAPLGDYAPRCRCLMVDYKDEHGADFHQKMLALHPNSATDGSLVQSIKECFPRLTAIAEQLPGGKWRALHIFREVLTKHTSSTRTAATYPGRVKQRRQKAAENDKRKG